MTKRILSVLLALVLVLGLSTVALADATIVVNSATDDQDYTAYKIFDITSASETAVSYKVAPGWEAFVAANSAYVTEDASGNITWVEGASAETFAQLALAYAKENNIEGYSATASNKSATITVPTAGYYVVDSTVGSLCMMYTNTGTLTIDDKNVPTDSEKTINPTNNTATNNNANIGDTVNYQVVIKGQKGADSLKLVDTMSAGLTFDSNSVVVKIGDTVLTAGTDYTVVTGGDATFEVVFTGILPLTDYTEITVTYSAELNENALIDEPNTNSAHVAYGDNYEIKSTTDVTETYTFDIDVLKVDGATTAPLTGAEFELYEGETKLPFTAVTGGYQYDAESTNYTLAVDSEGKLNVKGLKAGTYKLKETKAPNGYNLLTDTISLTIDNTGAVNGTKDLVYTVANNAGAVLPSTGGIGTTLFYVIGGLLMAFAVVLLVAKKRTVNE